MHGLEFDCALGRRRRRHVLRRDFHRRVQDVAEPLDRNLDLLEVLEELRQAQDRLHHLASDHVERDQFADGHLSGDHRLRAVEDDHRGGQRGDVGHRVLADRRQQRRLERALHIGGELLLPRELHHRLDRRRLQRVDADHGLDQKLLALGAAIELLLDLLAQDRAQHRGDQGVDRRGAQHHERHEPGIGEQHRDQDCR